MCGVGVTEAAGRHQAAGAARVAGPVGGRGQRGGRGGPRLVEVQLGGRGGGGGAVGQEAIEEQLVVFGGRSRGRCCHHHVVMLRDQREGNVRRVIRVVIYNNLIPKAAPHWHGEEKSPGSSVT